MDFITGINTTSLIQISAYTCIYNKWECFKRERLYTTFANTMYIEIHVSCTNYVRTQKQDKVCFGPGFKFFYFKEKKQRKGMFMYKVLVF